MSGLIVETEAYLGAKDPGAHTYNGRHTARVRSMYLGGGFAYVYFIYGNHFCINVVTGRQGLGEAVLIRALQPTVGLELMYRRRPHISSERQLANGPGKLCAALSIDRTLDGVNFFGPELYLEDLGTKIARDAITATSRIGLGCVSPAAQWPLRFLLEENLFISKKATACTLTNGNLNPILAKEAPDGGRIS
jgi:DNA-3-methyladenine glycosylase